MKKIFKFLQRQFFWKKIFNILLIIILFLVAIIFSINLFHKLNKWNNKRILLIESKKIENQNILESYEESKKESLKLLEESESLKNEIIKKNRSDAENEMKISSKYFHIGRYYRNNKTNQYGIIEKFQGLRIFFKEGWIYDIKLNWHEDKLVEDIVEVGYPEYRKNMLKQLNNKKNDPIEHYKLTKIWEEEQIRLSNYVSKLFPLHYSYVLTKDGIYDQVKGYDGLILVLKHSKKRVMYTDCKKISFHEYEKSKIKKEK